MRVRKLGIVDYQTAWEQMKSFSSQRTSATEDELWLCEHPSVYTLGTKASRQHILQSVSAPVVQTDRGGEVTFHGLGQLMIYPLIDLRKIHLYPKEFLHLILESVCEVVRGFGINTVLLDAAPGIFVPQPGGIGLFSGLAKIASVGLKISNHCTYHGISLNVDVDLENFLYINPCGYNGLRITSLRELGISAPLDDVAEAIAKTFVSRFQTYELY